jgi:hypothetical protein
MTSPKKIKTRRGTLTIECDGTIRGLWTVVRRELLTNEQVRRLCGDIPRSTLIRWRQDRDFPEPVLTFNASGASSRQVELWSRTEVEDWLKTGPKRT